MAQNTVNYTDNPTGPELLDDYLGKEQENILSSNSGIQRPSYAIPCTIWVDTSVTPWLYKMYDGLDDTIIGAINPLTHSFIADSIDESNLVHKTGEETITGNKTFTGNLIKSITSLTYNGVRIQNTQVTKGTTPSSSVGGQYVFQDKDGLDLEHRLGGIETVYGQDGIVTRVTACEPVESSTTYSWIGVIYPSSGSPYTYAPAPSLASNASGYANQIVTVGYLDGANSGVVHKTGDETISGNKTFLGANDTWTYLKTTSLAYTETPSTNNVYGGISFQDKNGHSIANIYSAYYTNGGGLFGLNLINHAGASGILAVRFDDNGNFYTQAPASDVNNSIVTTVSKTKAQNGYYKLGNGLIIQWGYTSSVSGNTTVSLPTSFTSTNYAVSFGINVSADSYAPCIVSKTSATFVYRCINDRPSYWVAIGY